MIKNHILTEATLKPSPNFNDRPTPEISLLIIHSISLPPHQFGNNYIEQFFTNQLDFTSHPYFKTIAKVEVSAHLLIKRGGDITQFVAFNKRAWHAGKSHFQGRENCNDFSIGIELEGDEISPFEPAQYQSLTSTIRQLKKYYPISHIQGHNDIAPGRKTDPGPTFDWSKIDEI